MDDILIDRQQDVNTGSRHQRETLAVPLTCHALLRCGPNIMAR
jgi:hypothetical protein